MARQARTASLAGAAAALALSLSLAPHATAAAQGVEWQRPRFRAELAAAGSGAFLNDGNGLEVRAAVAPVLGLAAAWPAGHHFGVALFARASVAGVDVSQGGSHWSAGRTRQLDVGAAVERRFLGQLFEARLGGGATWISGPGDVAPFRFLESTRPHLSGEAGGAVRLFRAIPLFGVVTVQGVSYGGASAAAPQGEHGTVTRLLGGVRYGR